MNASIRRTTMLVGMLVAALPQVAPGAQQVTLQSGAVIVGEVAMDGAELAIDVGGAKLRVPFKEVAMVTDSAVKEAGQADRLLLKALEARLTHGADGHSAGLLSEAFRLAPDDPRVAYWYARSLVDAGYGKGARDVFQSRRAAIAAVYPGLVDQLAAQIEQRIRTESLPPKLIKRLDQVAAAAGGASFFEDGELHAAYFRVVDQHDAGIPSTALRVSCNGNREKLESFADGYVLFTFLRNRSSRDDPCRLNVAAPGLKSAQFEFRATTLGAEDAGRFRVERYDDADRVVARVDVVDAGGEPLADTMVVVQDVDGRGDQPAASQKTSAQGYAELALFPGAYRLVGTREGYNQAFEPLEVAPGFVGLGAKLTLHRQLTGKALVAWRVKVVGYPGSPEATAESVTTGEAELVSPQGGRPSYGPYGPGVPWLRFAQTGPALELHVTEQMYYPGTGTGWIGRWKPTRTTTDEASESAGPNAPQVWQKQFEHLDLTKLDALKSDVEVVKPSPGSPSRPPGTTVLAAQPGAIYVGRVMSRDMPTGRPAVYEFKVLVTEIDKPAE
ncbi:MAG: hypothetical protein KF847_06050 [Pirellulales bacterium]|nr:hypothetical protein [Pirellulales bacterium]